MGRTGRPLTQDAFDCLLQVLDPDREAAGEKYADLHRRLVLFFRARGTPRAEDHADETLTAAATRMARGEVVQNVTAYCLGAARLVALEGFRAAAKEKPLVEEADRMRATPDSEADPRTAAFAACLAQLPGDQRELILEYYGGTSDERIARRKRLAARHGIPVTALRIRAHRIRVQLERAVQDALAGER